MNTNLSAGDFKNPAMVAATAVGAGLIAKKLIKTSLGVESNLDGAIKAFILITAAGGGVVWFTKPAP